MVDRKRINSCAVFKKQCECFELLTERQRELVEENQVVVEYKKGEVIARQGAFASHIIVLEKGLAKVMYENGDNNIILRISTPGSLIGLSSISESNRLFGYTAKAYINTIVRQIDTSVFIKLIEENSKFGLRLIKILSEISHQKNQRFLGLTHRQSYGKLADLLLCMSWNIFKDNKFELPLSRKQLGELAGMSAESVIRTLKSFQEDKLVKIDGKTIEIIDNDGLIKIFETG